MIDSRAGVRCDGAASGPQPVDVVDALYVEVATGVVLKVTGAGRRTHTRDEFDVVNGDVACIVQSCHSLEGNLRTEFYFLP